VPAPSQPSHVDQGCPLSSNWHRILITGGAGFLGSHLVERFLARGAEVICVDNLMTGRLSNVDHLKDHERLTTVFADVIQPVDIEGHLDAVLHFAALASPADYLRHPLAALDVGTLGTRASLRLADEKKARFLLASTSEVYGDPLVHPQPESYWGNVNPVGPRSVYDEAKRAAEAYTMSYHQVHGVDTRIARIFNTFGPRMRHDDGRAVPQFVGQALAGEPLTVYGDGSQTRSLCYVDDLIDGLERLLDSNHTEPVNIGNPNEITVLELAEMIRRLCGSDSSVEFQPLPVDDPRQRCPDIATARAVLGWQPNVSLAEGLGRTIDWWRREQASATLRTTEFSSSPS
jgi:dTDP-glucose 4,6-dehydratase